MPSTSQAFVFFLFICVALQTVSGRNIPTDPKVQPQWFGHFDGSVLIPGIGRVMLPPKGSHHNSFNYNPTTGMPGGNGVSIPGIGGSNPGGRSYVPGGDDTFLPNPGVEVPNPSGGGVPAPSRP